MEYHTEPTQIVVLNLAILTLLLVTAITMVRVRRLFAVVMLSGIYSLLSALFFVSLDAVDVAFTEAAVGAGISTVLMLSGMLLTARREKPVVPGHRPLALFVCVITGGVLIWASTDMPAFGDPEAPANAYVGKMFIERTPSDVEVPNLVTAVLASYRGFDTLGEVLVIFTAGVGVMLLLGSGSIRGGCKRQDIPPQVEPASAQKASLDSGQKTASPQDGGAS